MEITIKIREKITVFAVMAIFLFAFSWLLFFTQGFDFFGEDFDVFHVYWNDAYQFKVFAERYGLQKMHQNYPLLTLYMAKSYVANFFKYNRLFQIGFNSYSPEDRPYQFIFWDLLKVLFGKKAILYRMFKATIFAVNTCVVFFIISRASKLLALLGAFLYITSSEVWLSALYINNLGLLSQCATMLSVFLFVKLIEKGYKSNKDIWFYYFLILMISNVAVLTFGDARYIAIIFFVTILFFRKEYLILHAPYLFILFLMQFPILGYFKKVLFNEHISPINLTSHVNTSPSVLSTLYWTLANHKFLLNAIGKYVLLLIVVSFLFILTIKSINFSLNILNITKTRNDKSSLFTSMIKERLFMFLLWFISTFTMVAKVRNFRYGSDPISFMLYDLAYFIAPFIIFVCYFVILIHSNLIKKSHKSIYLILAMCLIILQIISNVKRLEKFRDAGGVEICSWRNAEKFIDNNSNNALAIAFTKSQYKPFVFYGSKNRVLSTQTSSRQSEFCNLSFIDSKFKNDNFEDIFVLGNNEIEFVEDSNFVKLYQKKEINSYTGDLHDKLKNLMGYKFKNVIYLYHFKPKNKIT